MSSSPRIAVFTTNPKGIYSGGRYLSMMLAHALGMAGAEVTYITNNLPVFDTDFEAFQDQAPIHKIVDPAFGIAGLRPADWVVVIPTGSFDDRFYDAARAAARTWHARLALLSFETPNWFSAVSPFPRSPLPSESWRQAISEGGLVVTIAAEGVGHARRYFGEDRDSAPLRFTHWHPPINDLAAAGVSVPEDRPRRILTFTRTEDPHKGAADLLRLPPETFENHTLSLIFGRGESPDYVAALRRHFGGVAGFAIESHSQISDVEKFALLAQSRLLLFPSYFEGYGYPPVEAAWMGVPTVAYDLPVLRETVGDAAAYVPPGDVAGFAAAIRKSLAEEPPGPHIRARMNVVPDVKTAGRKLLNSLIAATNAVHPLAGVPRPVPLPANPASLADPALSGLVAGYGSDQVQVHGVRAETDGQTLRITGRAHGATSNARLRFRMGGALIPDIRLADRPDGAQGFETVGRIQAWRAPGLEETCTIHWLKRNGALAPIGCVAVRAGPEIYMTAGLVQKHMRSHALRAGPEAVIVAETGALLGDGFLSLAIATLCDRLASRRIRSRLCLVGPAPRRADTVEVDLAPLADHVEITDTDGAGMALMACLETGSAGFSALPPEALSPHLSQAPVARISTGSETGPIHVFGPEGADPADPVAIPDPHLARRALLARKDGPVIVLGAETPQQTLPEAVLEILARVEATRGGVQVVLPRRLCAFDGADPVPFGLAGWVEVLEEARLSELCLAGPRIAGLMIGSDPFTAGFVTQIGGTAPVTWTPEAEAAPLVTALTEALAPPPADRDRALDRLLDRVLPEADPTGLPAQAPIWSEAFAASPPESPGTGVALDPAGVLSFSTPDIGHHAALIDGWAQSTTEGAWMSGALSTLGFDWTPGASGAETTYQLELLIRTGPGAKAGRLLAVNLNGTELGRVTQQAKPGVQKHVLPVPAGLLSGDGPQYLLLARMPAKPADDMVADMALVSLGLTPPAMEGPDWAEFAPQADPLAPLFHPDAVTQDLPRIIGHGRADVPTGLELWRGWSGPEADGRWSDGATGFVGVTAALAPGPATTLRLSGASFGTDPAHMQRVRLVLADGEVAEACLSGTRSTVAIALPQDRAPERGGYVALEFPDTATPFELLGTADHRDLGLLLTDMTLQTSAGAAYEARAEGGPAPVLLARRFPVATGVLRVLGRGDAARLQVSGDAVFVTPTDTGEGAAWQAWLRLDAGQIGTGHLVINALTTGAEGDDPAIEAITFWPDASAEAGPDAPMRGDVTLSLRRDTLPGDTRSWLNANRTQHDALVQARPLPLPFAARVAAAEPGGLGLEAGWGRPEEEFVWSVDDRAVLRLPEQLPEADLLLCLEAAAFLDKSLPLQRQGLICKDHALATIHARDGHRHARWFVLPREMAGARHLHLALPDATSPQDLGLSKDKRRLSMALTGLRLTAGASGPAAEIAHTPSGWTLRLFRPDPGPAILEVSGSGTAPPGLALAGGDIVLHPVRTGQGWRALFVLPEEVPEELTILQVPPDTEAALTPENHDAGATLRLADFEGVQA